MTKEIEHYKKRIHDTLLHGTPNDLAMMLAEQRIVLSDPEVLLMTWHKSITALQSLPREYRQHSKDWLTSRGYHSLDDGDLTA